MTQKNVGGVSGQIRVRNRTSYLMHFQALEYILANGALRLSQGAAGAVTIVPGPIGMFRRHVLEEIAEKFNSNEKNETPVHLTGPFSKKTFAEDFNLSLLILAMGYRIEYEPHAIAHTKAPDTIASLLSQRYRWNRGSMQVLIWYFQYIFSGGKTTGKTNTWIAIAFVLDYFFMPAVFFCLLLGLTFFIILGGGLTNILIWTTARWIGLLLTGALYTLVHKDTYKLLILVPIFEFYQGILLNCAWLIAIYDQIRGGKMRW